MDSKIRERTLGILAAWDYLVRKRPRQVGLWWSLVKFATRGRLVVSGRNQ
jgi:hypothetical protein